jgi:hypothetical protein
MGVSLLLGLGDPSGLLRPVGREERQGNTVSIGQVVGPVSPEERHDPEEHGEEEDRQTLVDKVEDDALHQPDPVGAFRTAAAEGRLVGEAARTLGYVGSLGA